MALRTAGEVFSYGTQDIRFVSQLAQNIIYSTSPLIISDKKAQ